MSRGESGLLGRWGEKLAAEELHQRGKRILSSGYRCRFGEIDLIAADDRYILFVEVKLRKNAAFAPAWAFVDQRKQERLRITAQMYLSEHPEEARQPRFDVVEVYAPQGIQTKKPHIVYWENAFW